METHARRGSDKHGQVGEYEEYEEIDQEEEQSKDKSSESSDTSKVSSEKETQSRSVVKLPLFKKNKVRLLFEKILHMIEKLSYFLIGRELKFFLEEKSLLLIETIVCHLNYFEKHEQ